MPTKTRPITKFAAAVAQCAKESAVYGKCIAQDYNNVGKDKCAKEFLRLQQCYTVRYC
jgi:NADH dehydrogenase [ubiquinone] 1 alpha subcomplex assembly factor 8